MEHHIDARQLLCPMPVIRLQDGMRDLQIGDRVQILCTDPGAKHDIPAWCRVHGHKVLKIEDVEDEILIQIQVCTK